MSITARRCNNGKPATVNAAGKNPPRRFLNSPVYDGTLPVLQRRRFPCAVRLCAVPFSSAITRPAREMPPLPSLMLCTAPSHYSALHAYNRTAGLATERLFPRCSLPLQRVLIRITGFTGTAVKAPLYAPFSYALRWQYLFISLLARAFHHSRPPQCSLPCGQALSMSRRASPSVPFACAPPRSSQPALIRRPRLCRRHSESASLRTVRLYALPFLPAATRPGACAKRFSCRASDAQFFSPAFGKHFREGIPVSRQQTAPLYRRSRFENPASRRMQRVCPGNANQFSLRRIRRRRDRGRRIPRFFSVANFADTCGESNSRFQK